MGDFQGHPFRGNQWMAGVPEHARIREAIVGKDGDTAIVGYEWRSHIEDVPSAREGGVVGKRVSDWGKSDVSTGTGRDIVHVFHVRHKTGELTVEGVNSAQRILGFNTSKLRGIADRERKTRERAAVMEKLVEQSKVQDVSSEKWEAFLAREGKGGSVGERIKSLGGFGAARKRFGVS